MNSLLQNTTRFCINSLQQKFSNLRIASPIVVQVREKGKVGKPRLRNPVWFVRKNRTIHDDFITSENQTFIKEVVADKFGPPSLIKGVETYQNTAFRINNDIDLTNTIGNLRDRRCGAIARKIGNVPLWKKNGQKIMTTMLQVSDNHVVRYISPSEYKPMQRPNTRLYNFGVLMIGAESADPSVFTKEYCQMFLENGVMPKRILRRFLISPNAALPPGTPINASHFRIDDYVDVYGVTIDRGFQGVMKRHGFKGMPASHGVTKTHRRPGNIGGGGEKARVWPGTKMPGHMGNRHRCQRGLRIWRINTKYNVMWVSGLGIPGATNSVVYIYDSCLPTRRMQTVPPFPTSTIEYDSSLPEDMWSDELQKFSDPTIMFKPE